MPIIGQEPCAAPSVDSFPERRQVKEHLGSRGRVSSLVLGGICRSIFWASCLHSWTSQYKVSCKIKRTFHVLLLPFKPLWRIFTVGASGASGRRLSFSMKSDGASPSVAIFFLEKLRRSTQYSIFNCYAALFWQAQMTLEISSAWGSISKRIASVRVAAVSWVSQISWTEH